MGGVLTLYFSSKCNNCCISCVNEDMPFELSLSKIKKYIMEGRKRNFSTVVITGGEPTINKKFIKIIELTKENGFMHIAIQTNARRLAQRRFLKTLISLGVDIFLPTLYGHYSQLHDFITRIEGSFIETVRGIKNIVDEGCFIKTNTIITKSNMEYLPEIAKFIISLSVNEAKFTFPHGIGKAGKCFEFIIPRFNDISQYLFEAIKELKESSVKPCIEAVPPCFLIGIEKYYADYIAERMDGFIPTEENEFLYRGEVFEKAYTHKCFMCDYHPVCSGIYIEYLLNYGDSEIKPVKIRRQ